MGLRIAEMQELDDEARKIRAKSMNKYNKVDKVL